MVAGKVIKTSSTMGLQQKPPNNKPSTSPITSTKHHQQQQQQNNTTTTPFTRSFGVYLPRASAQVQPTNTTARRTHHNDAEELLHLVEQLRESESRLKTELLEQKLLNESAAIVPVLEDTISSKDAEIERCREKIDCLEEENERLRDENERLHVALREQNKRYEEMIRHMQMELLDIKRAVSEQRQEEDEEEEDDDDEEESSSSSSSTSRDRTDDGLSDSNNKSCSKIVSAAAKDSQYFEADGLGSPAPRVPAPPPKPSASLLASLSTSSLSTSSAPVSTSSSSSLSESSAVTALSEVSENTPRNSSPRKVLAPPPPPPPPPPAKGCRAASAKVRRVPEVVEFYHTLMRRDSNCRREAGGGGGGGSVTADGVAAAKDMIGEIANRSAHLLAIKTDVETQGDLIRFLIKEVEEASFADIEDVLTFVKWLDHELSFLVDERAVLKHFDWPEKKADALREAAFGYCDLKKLESEASSFRDDPRQPCSHALKKMQSLFEKLEHGVYSLSRMRESSAKRYKGFRIPTNWMLDTGYVSQIKLASVKLAMKYMKRISAELEMVGGGPEEEKLIVHGVKFAFRVHQFAGGFDVETMRAFQELRDKAQLCNAQTQNQSQNQHKFVSRSYGAC